jgi:hypothetical protein
MRGEKKTATRRGKSGEGGRGERGAGEQWSSAGGAWAGIEMQRKHENIGGKLRKRLSDNPWQDLAISPQHLI